MKNSEKQTLLQELKTVDSRLETRFYDALEKIGDIKYNYADYCITEPINCDEELKRLPDADYELCCALLTMLLREDHFCNGSFERRFNAGQVHPILDRMIHLLSEGRR